MHMLLKSKWLGYGPSLLRLVTLLLLTAAWLLGAPELALAGDAEGNFTASGAAESLLGGAIGGGITGVVSYRAMVNESRRHDRTRRAGRVSQATNALAAAFEKLHSDAIAKVERWQTDDDEVMLFRAHNSLVGRARTKTAFLPEAYKMRAVEALAEAAKAYEMADRMTRMPGRLPQELASSIDRADSLLRDLVELEIEESGDKAA
jgi:hypothetical protein